MPQRETVSDNTKQTSLSDFLKNDGLIDLWGIKVYEYKRYKSIDSDSNSNHGQPFIVVTNPTEHQAPDQ